VESSGGATNAEIKTGFNAAVPINLFVALMPQVGVQKGAVTVDEEAPENVAAVQPSREEVRSWEKDFALGVSILRNVLPFGFGF
jgi:serine protease Do